ncbi:MAG TPA: GlsB/YeaQ/YmgE family stress response membrane protein [Aggregatilineaceae bacterium]|nr:GlsB/YeaQ/YmgE family stress response membrane protein [Aggregatilineaceae bacterium]
MNDAPTLEQIIAWIIIGSIAGALAGALVRRALTFGEMLVTGLIGAFLGGFIFNALAIELPEDIELTFTLADLIRAFTGASVLIIFAEIIIGRRRGRDRE